MARSERAASALSAQTSADRLIALFSGSVGFLSRAGSQLCILAVTILATRKLGVGDFGAYALAASIITLARSLYYFGAYEYLLKTPEYPSLKGSCLLANGLFAVLSCIVSLGFGFAAPWLFSSRLVEQLVLALVPSLLLAAVLAWFEALILRRQKLKTYYTSTLVAELVAAIAALWAFTAGFGVFSLVIQTYVRLLVLALWFVPFHAEARGWRNAHFADTRAILRWSWPRYSGAMLNYWSVYGADLLLGSLLNPAATGLYRASNRIVSSATDMFSQPLLKISQTRLSQSTARGDPLGKDWLTLFGVVATFNWVALAVMAVFAPTIVGSVLGHKWLPAVPIVVLLCVIRGVGLINSSATPYLACVDEQKFMLWRQIVTAVLIVLASGALAHFGPFWVAMGVGVVSIGGALALAHKAATHSGVTLRESAKVVGTALVPTVALLAVVLVVRAVEPAHASGWTSIAAEVALAGAGALLGLYAIRDSLISAALSYRAADLEKAGHGLRARDRRESFAGSDADDVISGPEGLA